MRVFEDTVFARVPALLYLDRGQIAKATHHFGRQIKSSALPVFCRIAPRNALIPVNLIRTEFAAFIRPSGGCELEESQCGKVRLCMLHELIKPFAVNGARDALIPHFEALYANRCAKAMLMGGVYDGGKRAEHHRIPRLRLRVWIQLPCRVLRHDGRKVFQLRLADQAENRLHVGAHVVPLAFAKGMIFRPFDVGVADCGFRFFSEIAFPDEPRCFFGCE